jgi:hypothetical protein
VSLSSAAEIPAGDSCTVVVTVTANAMGTYTNTIPENALEADFGSNADPASACSPSRREHRRIASSRMDSTAHRRAVTAIPVPQWRYCRRGVAPSWKAAQRQIAGLLARDSFALGRNDRFLIQARLSLSPAF